MVRNNLRFLALAACVLLAATAVACGDDDDDEDGGETPAAGDGNVVEVQVAEFSVIPDPSTVSAGEVTFRVTNDGPDDVHEFVIISTDLDDEDLPKADDGSVLEDDLEVVDEIEDIPVGETQELSVDLPAGSYVLICNIVEEADGEIEAHYSLGMHRAFTVE